jgi:hypothetical protein
LIWHAVEPTISASYENHAQVTILVMTKEPQIHSTAIELSEAVPGEVAVGADIVLRPKVSCSAGCDLRGLPVKVDGPDGLMVAGALTTFEVPVNESEGIAVKTPLRVGEHTWTIVFEPQENGDIGHAGCSLPVTVKAIAHGTSLAVWDIPSPVVMGTRFTIKVGAKSAANCGLSDAGIEVCDGSGAVAASGRLGETPWPGTSALYWAAVELTAPGNEGLSAWSVRFAAADLALPHDGSVAEFRVAIVRPPEHRLTVKVIEKDSRAPIEDVQVRLGAYRAATDPSGMAEVMMPKGVHELHVWKAGYEAPSRPLDVNGEISVEVEASIIPEEDPDAAWTM